MGTEKTSFHLAIIIVAAFVFLMLAVFFLLLYRQQKKLLLLQQEKNTDAMMRSEKERSEMAMQLHNEIVPYLAGVKLRLRMIQDHHADIQSACLPGLENSLQAIRGLSKKMAPMGIFRESFVEAIEHYVESTGMGDTLSVELHVKAMPEIEYEKHVLIYRLLQEVVLNTFKHSKAKRLTIAVSIDEENLVIRTADDGIGYYLDEDSVKQGMGIRLMQHILESMGGNMYKSEMEGSGTKYNFVIPC